MVNRVFCAGIELYLNHNTCYILYFSCDSMHLYCPSEVAKTQVSAGLFSLLSLMPIGRHFDDDEVSDHKISRPSFGCVLAYDLFQLFCDGCGDEYSCSVPWCCLPLCFYLQIDQFLMRLREGRESYQHKSWQISMQDQPKTVQIGYTIVSTIT